MISFGFAFRQFNDNNSMFVKQRWKSGKQPREGQEILEGWL